MIIPHLGYIKLCQPPPMTSADLQAWQAHMGYTQAQAADALGAGISAYKDWCNGLSRTTGKPVRIDMRTGLACAALAANLLPWPARSI